MNTHEIIRHTGLLLAMGLLTVACDDADDIGRAPLADSGDVDSEDDGYENEEPAGSSDDGADDGGTDDGGADDRGDDDDGGDDEGQDAPAACGDGMLDEDRGERCDDGNLDELDGCMSTCRPGPTGLFLDYEVSSPLDARGNAGGIDFDQECPEGEVIIGMVGRSGAIIDRVQVQCGGVELTSPEPGALEVSVEEGTMLDALGGEGGGQFSLYCPQGYAVVGFGGQLGADLERLSLTCAPVMISYDSETGDPALGFGERIHTGMAGGGSSPSFNADCPGGQLATSIHGRAEAVVNAFGMACRPVVLN